MRPPTTAVTRPFSGRTPDAIPKAIASGSAMSATVRPAPTSAAKSSRRYPRRLSTSRGRNGKRKAALRGGTPSRRRLHRLDGRVEVVARAAFRADQLGLVGALLDLAAQPQDLHVDRAVVDVVVQAARLEELVARQDLLRRAQEGDQQRVLAVGELDVAA